MLSDLLPQALGVLRNRDTRERTAREQKEFGDRLKDLKRELPKLAAIQVFLQATGGAAPTVQGIISYESMSNLVDTLSAVSEDAGRHRLSADSVRALRMSAQNAERELLEGWRRHVDEVAGGLLQTLVVAAPVSPDSRRATELAGIIKQVRDSTVLEPSSIDSLSKAITEANAIMGALRLEPSIHQFLARVSNREASVADLSEDVTAWLRQMGLEHRISLVFLTDQAP